MSVVRSSVRVFLWDTIHFRWGAVRLSGLPDCLQPGEWHARPLGRQDIKLILAVLA